MSNSKQTKLPILSDNAYKKFRLSELLYVKGLNMEDACMELGITKVEGKRQLRKLNKLMQKRAEKYLSRSLETFMYEFILKHKERAKALWAIVNQADKFDEKARVMALKLLKDEDVDFSKLMDRMRVLPKRPKEEEKPIEVSWED